MTHFLELFLDALPAGLCEEIIARFEQDPRRFPSRTANSSSPQARQGTMLIIGDLPEWADTAGILERTLRRHIDLYVEKYQSLRLMAQPANSFVTSPVIERIDPGQGYGWHIDAGPARTYDRLLSALFYLRDVPEGGATEFPFQEIAVRPKAGALLLFPPFWTHLHRGASPVSSRKYNITSYLVLRDAAQRDTGPESGPRGAPRSRPRPGSPRPRPGDATNGSGRVAVVADRR